MFGGEVIGNRLSDVAEDVKLFTGKQVGKAMPNRSQVRRRSSLKRSQAVVSEHHVEAAGVIGARGSSHSSAGLHAGDLMGETAALPAQPAAEVARTHPPAGFFGDLDKNPVIGL
jgi:hypothetical protein